MYKKSLKRLNETASISSEAYKRLDTLRALLHEMENEVEAIGRGRPDLDAPVDFFQEVEQFEIELIRGALKLAHGHQLRASKLLGLKHTTLNSKIKRYGIDVPFTQPLGADSRGEHERGRRSN
jgi:transcriptional regulator with GAF, ATPase, and Fis domain